MKYSKIMIAIFFTSFFAGCKKNDSNAETKKDEFSFTYNGRNYNYSITGNVANAGVGKGIDGTPYISIDMADVFGGRIHFEKTGCAYLQPEFTYNILLNQGCQLSEITAGGNTIPIDSVKVFVYQSGSLNVSFSNCITKSGVDIFTGLNYQYDICAALGTFDLVLANKNNETIKITNGIVKFHHVIVR
jgi:hypothetical protein